MKVCLDTLPKEMVERYNRQDPDTHDYGSMSRYNTAPPGWRPVDMYWLVTKHVSRTHHPDAIEHRQVRRMADGSDLVPHPELDFERAYGKGPSDYMDVTLYWFYDGTGYAVYKSYWDGIMVFFGFGCAHKYKEISHAEARELGMNPWGLFCHTYLCEKCGHHYAVDSSG